VLGCRSERNEVIRAPAARTRTVPGRRGIRGLWAAAMVSAEFAVLCCAALGGKREVAEAVLESASTQAA
jgi:hypothetical protein